MLIIDRFEGDFAVVESGTVLINIPIKDIPASAKERDAIKIVLDDKGTKEREKKIGALVDELFK